MDKYKQLIVIFSDALKMSKDYHIAYIHGIGYASVIGVYQKGNKMNSSMQIDVILVRHKRWQTTYYRTGDGSGITEIGSICKVRIMQIFVRLIVIYLSH